MPETLTPPATDTAASDQARMEAAFKGAGYDSPTDAAPSSQDTPTKPTDAVPAPKTAAPKQDVKPTIQAKTPDKPAAPRVDDVDPEDAINDLKELHALRKKYKQEAAEERKRQPKQLRQELDNTKAERDQERKAKAELEAKIKDAEEKGKNTDALQSKLTEMEKEIKARDERLSVVQFQESKEYVEKFQAPYDRLVKKAKEFTESLVKPDGTKATWEDFALVYNTPNGLDTDKAAEIFGERNALRIIDRIEKIRELQSEGTEALEAERANWESNSKKRQEESRLQELKQNQFLSQEKEYIKNAVEEIGKSVPGYSDPVGENADEEAAALRAQHRSIFHSEPKNPEEKAKKIAHIVHRFAGYPVLELQNQRLKQENEELKKSLADAKDPQPLSGGSRKPGGAAAAEPEVDEGADLVEVLRNAR